MTVCAGIGCPNAAGFFYMQAPASYLARSAQSAAFVLIRHNVSQRDDVVRSRGQRTQLSLKLCAW